MARQLCDAGFENAYALTGGFDAWQAAGMPVEPNERNETSDGSGKQPRDDGAGKKIAAEVENAQRRLENE